MITGRISAQEYVAAGLLSRHRKSCIWYAIAAVLIVAGLTLFFWEQKPGFVLAGAGIGGLIGGFIDNRLYAPRRLRQLYAQSKNADVSYTWDDDKLSFTYEQGHGSYAWSELHKAQENHELILLYVNDVLYQIIPKRWFATAAELDSFKRHLNFKA